MIGRLTGKIVECSPGDVLLEVGGVGYALQVPLSTFYELVGDSEGPVVLHVHTHVREDALQLFGFSSLAERRGFEILISISGVGPRMALAILSGIGVAELRRTVADGDRARLQKIPGVGRKTAERLLLELRDRLKGDEFAPDHEGGASIPPVSRDEAGGTGDTRGDALSALVNLGYAEDAARRAVDLACEAEGPEAGLEAVLRLALGRLAG